MVANNVTIVTIDEKKPNSFESLLVIEESGDGSISAGRTGDVGEIKLICGERPLVSVEKGDKSRCGKNSFSFRDEVTVNKGVITDQNVAITGEILMVSPIELRNDEKCRSKSTMVYIGEMEEVDMEELLKSVDITHSVEEGEHGPESVTLSFSQKISDQNEDQPTEKNTASTKFKSFVEQKPLEAPALLLQWKMEEAFSPTPDEYGEEVDCPPLTPSSSMFSSAYTVTELSSDRSSPSSNSTLSQRSDYDLLECQGDTLSRFREYLRLFRQLSAYGEPLETDIGERESRPGSDRSIVFNYIPCREQREREQEELWVANEDIKHSNKEVINKNEESSSKCIEETSKVHMVSASTQTSHSCFIQVRSKDHPDQEQLLPNKRKEQTNNEEHAITDSPVTVQTPLLKHALPVTESDSDQMSALTCISNVSKTRHFTTRQRITTTISSDEKTTEKCKNDICADIENAIDEAALKDAPKDTVIPKNVTLGSMKQPTKRFSFLIRSKNDDIIEDKSIMQITAAVSPSDQAILAKLEALKLKTSISVPSSTSTSPSRPATSPANPLCRNCQQPVYMKERVQAGPGEVYHSQCFKCNQCGVKLNLNSSNHNPHIAEDRKVYCRSHVPSFNHPVTFNGGILHQKKTLASPCRIQENSALKLSDREIVKGDTIGLKYF